MVRAKGKANASTKRSVSARAAVSSEAALTNDSSEMENNVEAGGLLETAVTEQTMITDVAEEENDGFEENDGAEEEIDEAEEENDGFEENDGAEEEIDEAEEENDGLEENDGAEEENDGGEAETLGGELAMNEDEANKENKVVGGDETSIDDKKAEDAIGNDEGNNPEIAIEQEGGKQNITDKKVGGAAGIDKDNQEDVMGKNEDETNAKNKEEVEGSSKQKTKRLRRRNNRKRKANGTPQEKAENKQVMKKVASDGKVGKDSGKLDSKVVEQSSKKVVPKVVEGKDKPEPSRKKSSAKKKANSMGMIFMCNSETKKDCYRYKVLGLPSNKKETVEKIYKGMRLFLYDVDLKLMYGIYKAAGRGGCNIEPKAFKSQFPSQVRFTVLEECLPLAEETFRQAIKKNYYTRGKFDCQLSSEQVKDLCKLFTAASKGSRSKDTWLRPETRVISKRDRANRRDRDERRRPDHVQRFGQVEEHGYRERVEDRRYHEQVEDRRYREQVEDRVYREHPHLHERSLITSPPLVPLAPLRPLPPPAPVQSYAYDRTLGRDPYRRDTVIQHDDPYRQSRLVEFPDAYRRDTVISNPDVYRRQALVEPHDYYRREGVPERREYHRPLNLEIRLQDEGGINDPYVSYRERLPYRDPVNSVRSQPEYNPPPAGLRSEYRHGGISTEYSSSRSMRPEYPSSAAGSLYEYPRQPRYRY
ncbi:hypothetical protein HAX54_035391 [Datura stramonium]|uniref:DCD domain-containing protein n=1 Tax=Datura stramonium TaxID=4076 RepID=A0ABS8SFD6_DATST|nr:hypothetical protein [Datura stramonium]